MSEEKESKKQNNEPLTRNEQHKIRALIRVWKTKFTWDLLVAAALSKLKIKISRQALSSATLYKAINDEYHKKKAALRGVTAEVTKIITMSDVDLAEKVEEQNALIQIKDEQIEKQLALIKRMLANAQEIPNYDLSNLMKPRND